jgi:hypothetical protein
VYLKGGLTPALPLGDFAKLTVEASGEGYRVLGAGVRGGQRHALGEGEAALQAAEEAADPSFVQLGFFPSHLSLPLDDSIVVAPYGSSKLSPGELAIFSGGVWL